jgi:hypothetical protein
MNRRENLLSEISIVCTAVYISLLPSNEVPVKQTYAVNTSSLKFWRIFQRYILIFTLITHSIWYHGFGDPVLVATNAESAGSRHFFLRIGRPATEFMYWAKAWRVSDFIINPCNIESD